MKKKLRLSAPPAPAVAAIAAVIIMVLALICKPVIGMADNGDFYRVSNSQGIYKLDRYEDDQFFSYAATEYGLYHYFNEYEGGLISSQIPLIRLAKALDSLFTGDDGIFDIRFMGILLIIYCAAALYFFVDYLTYKVKTAAGYLIAALCVFIFADTGYTAYFNSFFAEGLAMISFLFMMASVLLMTQKRYSPYALLIIFVINAAVLTTSKQQNAPIGVIAGTMLIIVCFMISSKDAAQSLPEQTQEPIKSYIKDRFRYRATVLICGAALCATGVTTYLLIPQEFININSYHAMTRGIMMTAENPEEALAEFDISPQYALLNKSIYYDRNPVIDVESDTLKKDFYSHYNFASILTYYMRHPGQMMQMLNLAAKNAWTVRPATIGNYDRSEGLDPGAQTDFFTAYTTFKDSFIPRTIGFIIVWMAVLLIFGFKDKKREVIIAFAMLMGLSQFLVSIIGAGDADLSKHIFLFGVTFDFATVVGVSAAIAFFARMLAGKARLSANKAA